VHTVKKRGWVGQIMSRRKNSENQLKNPGHWKDKIHSVNLKLEAGEGGVVADRVLFFLRKTISRREK